ncbi:MAG: prepilin-type N-terminal cleavage/methylation domain-containing protein [Acidobacteria bacterium]|nr:prepilin-type N-terminal cleavage/methylation domain-containing protein [Acidobacteriota bacterium]
MASTSRGFSLVEMILVLALIGFTALLGAPDLIRASTQLRLRLAAEEVARALHRARMTAIRTHVQVAVRFEVGDPRHITFRLFRDGDGDGVRNADIDQGIDPAVEAPRPLRRLGAGVGFGFPRSIRPRDPGNPRRFLTRLDDPIRFNRSDLASFGPLGTGTPGSAYLTAGDGSLAVVRVFNRTGKIEILTYDAETETWRR